MKIAIATVQVPFITGGAEILVAMLKDELIKRGHQAEIVSIPFKWYPAECILDCMMMGRMMDLTEVNGEKIDMVIAMKFPAYYVKHPNKVIWLMHQHRQAYELWDTEFGDMKNFKNGDKVRELITHSDTRYIKEAKRVFTIAKNTSQRLINNNGIDSEVLYHPPLNYKKLFCKEYGDFVFYASRIDPMKRQRNLVEAMKYVKTDVKAVIAGRGSEAEMDYINSLIRENHLENRVILPGFISEEEKIDYYSRCLAVYFGTYDEDYGYITLEGFFSQKPVIVHPDAGEPLAFVRNEENGFVVDNDPRKLAAILDDMYQNREKVKKLGISGWRMMQELNINWDYVIDRLIDG